MSSADPVDECDDLVANLRLSRIRQDYLVQRLRLGVRFMTDIVDELVQVSQELTDVDDSLDAQMDKLFERIMATKGDLTKIAAIRDQVKAGITKQREALLRNTIPDEIPPKEPNPPGAQGQSQAQPRGR